ncbi:MAG: aminodeoxychorismate synthase, component I, partial [Desulfotomaculales bacterium]
MGFSDGSLPIFQKLSLEADVTALFAGLSSRPYSFLLDSGLLVPGLGRYSLLGADPFLVLRSRGRRIRLEQRGKN